MSELFEFLVLLDINEKLGQSVKNKLSFINKDINFILQKLLTVYNKFMIIPFLRSSGMVALNIITCLLCGVLTKIYWISALIPGFPKTLSHSSITKNLHLVRLMILFLAKSFSLPGVAMITCGVLFGFLKSAILSYRGTPPKYAPNRNYGFLKYRPVFSCMSYLIF